MIISSSDSNENNCKSMKSSDSINCNDLLVESMNPEIKDINFVKRVDLENFHFSATFSEPIDEYYESSDQEIEANLKTFNEKAKFAVSRQKRNCQKKS